MSKKAKTKRLKEYKIKVPVYSTEKKKGSFSYESVISYVESQLRTYNTNINLGRVAFRKSNKTQQKVIKDVECFRFNLGANSDYSIPVLLLKFNTYNTNYIDGYYEETDGVIRHFDKETKIGSEYNYLLLYPNFVGYEPKQKVNWLTFVYGDPNKIDSEITNTAKLVLNEILHLGFLNIKPKDVLKELKKISIPILQIRYTGIEVDEKYNEYITKSKLKKDKTLTYENIPYKYVEELLDQEIPLDEYQKRENKFILGKNEYKITTKLIDAIKEAEQAFEETADHVFTDNFVVTDADIDKIYDHQFIIEKLEPIISNYINSYVS